MSAAAHTADMTDDIRLLMKTFYRLLRRSPKLPSTCLLSICTVIVLCRLSAGILWRASF